MTAGELDRLAAACLLPGFDGTAPPDWLRAWLARGLAGVVLFSRNVENPEQVAALTAALREERPPVIVAIDEEGGDVTRLEHARGSSYPGNYALGVVDDTLLTRAVAAAIGTDLAAVGVNLDFAPVADVNTNPRNPVVGIRAFGARPALVARHVAAFVSGLQSAGVGACAKHFPGHGDTELDSHHELPTVAGDLEPALVPFRAAIAAGVASIMTAHIRVPALGDEPATLNRQVLTHLLRDELGFTGATITDALDMKALSDPGDAAVRSLAAGADLLCLGPGVDEQPLEAAHAAVVAAVQARKLSEERLYEAATRASALAFSKEDGSARERAIAARAASLALRAEGAARLVRPPLVVELVPEPSVAAGPQHHGLGEILGADGVRLTAPPANGEVTIAPEQQLVLVVRDAHRHGWEREVADALLASVADGVVVETGIPLWRPQRAAAYLATHGAGRANLEAAAERLRR